jgi:hypothetical protein
VHTSMGKGSQDACMNAKSCAFSNRRTIKNAPVHGASRLGKVCAWGVSKCFDIGELIEL